MSARDRAKEEAEASGKIVIKKYANRRLYNTSRSSYVTLDDLAQMVRAGQDFAVYDAKSGEDITRSVLTQIIFEEEAKGHAMLPTGFLRQIIGLYGDTLQTVVPGYLEASMKTFAENQERMRKAFGGEHALANFEALARSNVEWFDQAMRMFAPLGAAARGSGRESGRESGRGSGGAEAEQGGAPGNAPGNAPRSAPGNASGNKAANTPDPGENLDQLQRQLREMQEQLDRLSRDRKR